MAKLIRDDGRCEEIKPAHKTFTAAEVQVLVGGFFEILQTKRGQMMLVDEDGKTKRKKINRVASDLYKFGNEDPVRGDVLIVSRREFK